MPGCWRIPINLLGTMSFFAGHHGNATGVLALAVNMALLEPTEAHVSYANNLVLAGTITPAGVWNAIATPFPGQQTYFGAEDAQAIVPLLHYYPMAPTNVRAQIVLQAQNWLQFLQTQQESTWGMSQDDIYAYFGGCGALTLNTAGLLLMYKTLGTQAALEYAQNNMDWVWGRNPFGMGFIPGLGRDIGVMPFLRPVKNSYGAVLPGTMTNIDGSSLRITADVPWDAWEVGEATLDASSALLWVLTMLQKRRGPMNAACCARGAEPQRDTLSARLERKNARVSRMMRPGEKSRACLRAKSRQKPAAMREAVT